MERDYGCSECERFPDYCPECERFEEERSEREVDLREQLDEKTQQVIALEERIRAMESEHIEDLRYLKEKAYHLERLMMIYMQERDDREF